MSGKVRLGMIGGGQNSFIGVVHRIAACMGEKYRLIGGAFTVDYNRTLQFAEELELDKERVYATIDDFIEGENKLSQEERIEAVTIATPNHLHYSMAIKLLEGGFHVICEKPLTLTVSEAEDLQELVDNQNLIFAVAHAYTGYPMVRQMKSMIAEGVIGKIQKVDAQYYQGWINPFIHEKERRKEIWRLDPEKAGISCCMGDIGVHAFNMVEFTTGLEVRKILSDLNTLYHDNSLDVDGSVLVRLDGEVRGMVRASQIATGEENDFQIAVYGDKGGLRWEQENPNYLYYFHEGEPLRILKPGHPFLSDFEKESVKLPPGHPEGIFDAMGNIYNGVAAAIRRKEYHEGAFPSIQDGVRGMKFIEKAVQSSKEGNVWIEI